MLNMNKIKNKNINNNKGLILNSLEDVDLNTSKNFKDFKDFHPILDVFTIQMSKWRKLPNSIKLISTVAKDKHFFSPEWKIVDDSKNGKITPSEYEEFYFQSLINKLKKDKSALIKSIKQDSENFNYSLAYSCYCPVGKFCHRHLIIKFLKIYFKDRFIQDDCDYVKNISFSDINLELINDLKKDVKIDFMIHFKNEFE